VQSAKTIRSLVVRFKQRTVTSLASKSAAVSSLLDYPVIADAFRNSNATLPNSAAVDFSL